MQYEDPKTQESYEATVEWIMNMSRDEAKELAAYLVDNGYGVLVQQDRERTTRSFI